MSAQLVLTLPGTNQSEYCWCWRNAEGQTQGLAHGDQHSLQSTLASWGHSGIEAWLILPGEKLVTRELEYTEKEKKHLRNLLPFQLEDSLIGDVADIHLAIAEPRQGRVSIAYTDRVWLKAQIDTLKSFGLDIVRCSALPLVWNLAREENEWIIAEYQDQIHVQYGSDLGFSVANDQAGYALQLLLAEQKPESIILRASDPNGLAFLEKILPPELNNLPRKTEIKEWHQNLVTNTIDFCQGEFSRRLPVERWWKIWKSLAIFAGMCLLISLLMVIVQIRQLNKENLQLRMATETAARSVIPQGKLTNVEKQVQNLLSQLQPRNAQAGLMELLATSLPLVSHSTDVKIKALNYSQETSELSISLQANDFSIFEQITNSLKEKGLQAEILNVNAEGSTQTARLRIHK